MKKYLDILLINILTLIIVIILYTYLKVQVEILGAILATGISISLGIRQYKIENDKIFKELFVEFNTKYDEKYNDVLNSINNEYEKNNNYIIPEPTKKIVIDYFSFCAEEYLWYSKERIPECVWKSWKEGMLFFLKLKPIKKILEREINQAKSYYGFFEKIVKKEILKN